MLTLFLFSFFWFGFNSFLSVQVHDTPPMYVCRNFLTADECQLLMESGGKGLKRSIVVDGKVCLHGLGIPYLHRSHRVSQGVGKRIYVLLRYYVYMLDRMTRFGSNHFVFPDLR